MIAANLIQGHSWMVHIDNDTTLNQITIPGSHDTMTYLRGDGKYGKFPGTVTFYISKLTQARSLREQLDFGVRCFDIRINVEIMRLVHDDAVLKGSIANDFVSPIIAFLKEHPSEVILVDIGIKDGSMEDLCRKITSTFNDLKFWDYLWENTKGTQVPTIQETRGKVVFRQTWTLQNKRYGLGLTGSGDNANEAVTTWKQNSMNANTRIRFFKTRLYDVNARMRSEHKWFETNLNVNQFPYLPEGTAKDMNGAISPFIQYRHNQSRTYGVIFFDFISSTVADAVYRVNFAHWNPNFKGHNEKTLAISSVVGKRALESVFGTYISAQPKKKPAEWNRDTIGDWEKFSVEQVGANTVALKSCHGKYLSAQPNGSVLWNAQKRDTWETWTVEIDQAANQISLKSVHNKYLSAQANGTVCADRAQVASWEKFVLVEV